MKPLLHLYIDETGSRRPDRKPNEQPPKHDFFAMGGLLINEEDESCQWAPKSPRMWACNFPYLTGEGAR